MWVNFIQSAENIKSKTGLGEEKEILLVGCNSAPAQDFLACQPTLDIC